MDGMRVRWGIDHLIVLIGHQYTKLLKCWDCASHNLFWKGQDSIAVLVFVLFWLSLTNTESETNPNRDEQACLKRTAAD